MLTLSACTSAAEVTCPDLPPSTDLRFDWSDSRHSNTSYDEHLATIRVEVEYTSLCHGHLQASAFSSSTGATAPVYSGELEAEGATMPARQRKLDETVDSAMDQVIANLDSVGVDLPGDGTDVLGQLDLMAEYFAQRPDTAHRGLLLTDGIQTAGSVVLNDAEFTEEVAADLAERVPVPDLSGAEVTIAGIGEVAGEPPPSSYIRALKTFWRRVCERTGAACLVVTDLAAD